MLLPSALGSSPYPPVSVYGTGPVCAIAAFPDSPSTCFATFPSLRFTPSLPHGGLPSHAATRACTGLSIPGSRFVSVSPHVLTYRSTGISTCCPSATPPGLALGPDLPRADQLYPGNLGYPADRIPTYLSLLIPAFSLPCSPLPLTVQLLPAGNAPLPPA